MDSDIVIVRDGESYRVMHGHLRLSNMLAEESEVTIEVKDEGKVKITRSKRGYLAGKDGRHLPLYPN